MSAPRRLTLKEAQELINGECDKWKVPRIKVIEEDMPKSIQPCYLHDEYYLAVKKGGVSEKTLLHEFHHYLLRLIRVSYAVEEALSNKFADWPVSMDSV